ncbi:sigma-70 family RNA polymerase sigma factor [Belliella sp. DSM 111904]|uniref:Sigma-70 family RNA polymerase sigma factor n=1 Tax=Belliella filtrata TaxID=2923435 RepID=A0ABS9UWP8_9BACT|nr:sigma-70 family RNA polymerase sigma factor [Belliella filtrata]MCH7408584.1 sigma-70 family RNA polymerase sigma factor [Belliella filtrata]
MINTNNKPYFDILKNDDFPSDRDHQIQDIQLWNDFRSGSEAAFITIYTTYFDQLFAYGKKMVSNQGLVKDAIQDLFIELRNSRSRLGETNRIKFYLFKSLKRKLFKEENKKTNKLEALDDEYYFNFSFSPEQLLINRQVDDEISKKLNEAIAKLSPRKKEVIYYYFYEQMDYKQIQDMMNLDNVKSVRNLIYKSLDFLRNIY